MSNRDLYAGGRDVFTYVIENPPTIDTPEVLIDGAWHALTMVDTEGSVNVHAPDCPSPEVGSVEVTESQEVFVNIDDVIRPAGFIRLVSRP